MGFNPRASRKRRATRASSNAAQSARVSIHARPERDARRDTPATPAASEKFQSTRVPKETRDACALSPRPEACSFNPRASRKRRATTAKTLPAGA